VDRVLAVTPLIFARCPIFRNQSSHVENRTEPASQIAEEGWSTQSLEWERGCRGSGSNARPPVKELARWTTRPHWRPFFGVISFLFQCAWQAHFYCFLSFTSLQVLTAVKRSLDLVLHKKGEKAVNTKRSSAVVVAREFGIPFFSFPHFFPPFRLWWIGGTKTIFYDVANYDLCGRVLLSSGFQNQNVCMKRSR
jgi:hypothetical protein